MDFQEFLGQVRDFFSELPGNIQAFFEDLPENLQKLWAKTQAYFKSCDQWEYVGWGGEAVGFIMVLVALIFW